MIEQYFKRLSWVFLIVMGAFILGGYAPYFISSSYQHETWSPRFDLTTGPAQLVLGKKISLNRATLQDLTALPGIGPGLARRMVQHRENFGPYQSFQELLLVPGIGPKKYQQIKINLML